jgi:hypothetical protein
MTVRRIARRRVQMTLMDISGAMAQFWLIDAFT